LRCIFASYLVTCIAVATVRFQTLQDGPRDKPSPLFRNPLLRERFCDPGRDSLAPTRCPPNPYLSRHFFPAMISGSLPIAPRAVSPTTPITARISMKTIIEPPKSFFHPCIMNLGALRRLTIFCGPRLVSTLLFTAPRIFDNRI